MCRHHSSFELSRHRLGGSMGMRHVALLIVGHAGIWIMHFLHSWERTCWHIWPRNSNQGWCHKIVHLPSLVHLFHSGRWRFSVSGQHAIIRCIWRQNCWQLGLRWWDVCCDAIGWEPSGRRRSHVVKGIFVDVCSKEHLIWPPHKWLYNTECTCSCSARCKPNFTCQWLPKGLKRWWCEYTRIFWILKRCP